MRIGIITPRYPPNHSGGGEVSARLLARMLSTNAQIDDVIVYTFDGEGPAEQDGIRIERYDSPLLFSFEVINTYAYFKLRSALSEDGADILHSYNMQLHPVVGHLSKELGIPSVATLNSYAFIPYRKINIPVQNLLELYKNISCSTTGHLLRDRIRQVDAYLAISSTVAEIYRKTMLPDQRIEVIPNMYEPDLFDVTSDSSDGAFNLNNDTINILYVGSLRDTKGVNHIIEATTYLPNNYHVTIAGGGKSEDDLREFSADLGVDDRVSLLGRVPHDTIQELYAGADLFVHPGIWPEPFGRTILEAMQFGLPVVATDIGGPAEVIPQEQCLCEPENPVDIAETIEDVYSDRNEIGEQNRRHVKEHYSPEIVVPQIIDLYEQVSK